MVHPSTTVTSRQASIWILPSASGQKSMMSGTRSFNDVPIPKKTSCCSVCRPEGLQPSNNIYSFKSVMINRYYQTSLLNKGRYTSAIMQRALPPPLYSIVSNGEWMIALKDSNNVTCSGPSDPNA